MTIQKRKTSGKTKVVKAASKVVSYRPRHAGHVENEIVQRPNRKVSVTNSEWANLREGYCLVTANREELIKTLREGIPPDQVQWLSDTYGISKSLILSSLGLSSRTIHRRSELLNLVESEKIMQLTIVLNHAKEILGDVSKATDWVQTSNMAIGGATPLSLLDTSFGFSEVMTILDRIDYGVYS